MALVPNMFLQSPCFVCAVNCWYESQEEKNMVIFLTSVASRPRARTHPSFHYRTAQPRDSILCTVWLEVIRTGRCRLLLLVPYIFCVWVIESGVSLFRDILFDICVLLKRHSTDKTRVPVGRYLTYDAGIV